MHAGVLVVAVALLVDSPGHEHSPPGSQQAMIRDVMTPIGPAGVELRGWLNARVAANAQRLAKVDLEPLLAGYRVKPGSHPWIGEHIGKWMHAAALAWANTSDPTLKAALRTKLDYAAAELIKAQEQDGYLGTYIPAQRFGLFSGADWDVWSHKYCMIGLLAYHEQSGDEACLAAARRAADLLVRTFSPAPAGEGKSIISAGTHVGMAATSVLEPMVRLYALTGERTYLEFAELIVTAYDEPGGPGIVESLLTHASVHKTANGKAYEMLSNLVGLCELYRATGNLRYLNAARNGWEDVVRNQLYITGTSSHHEHFHEPHGRGTLPNEMSDNVGETCVTVTWVQLCSQLLRLTGEARYGDEFERSVYNHLAAAQHPGGGSWCYYTSLEGTKPYTADTCCCLSSGPRGIAMAPGHVFLKGSHDGHDALVVNLFEPASATVVLDGRPVRVRLETDFPRSGGASISVASDTRARFAVMVRAPEWSEPMAAQHAHADRLSGWMVIPAREWTTADRITLDFTLAGRVVPGVFGNSGKAAAMWGPMVLAYEAGVSGTSPEGVWLDGSAVTPVAGAALRFEAPVCLAPHGERRDAVIRPFAETGANGERYRIWLGAPGTYDGSRFSLLFGASESRSIAGNISGSIVDGDHSTQVVTYDGADQPEAWFAATPSVKITFRRIVFVHGTTFHDGGWFDTSAEPVRVEVQREAGGDWEQIATLSGYPRTTATEPSGLKGGERFEVVLGEPISASAVRVRGVPACGDTRSQRFASCAELAVHAE